jgi:hypothetical protein
LVGRRRRLQPRRILQRYHSLQHKFVVGCKILNYYCLIWWEISLLHMHVLTAHF